MILLPVLTSLIRNQPFWKFTTTRLPFLLWISPERINCQPPPLLPPASDRQERSCFQHLLSIVIAAWELLPKWWRASWKTTDIFIAHECRKSLCLIEFRERNCVKGGLFLSRRRCFKSVNLFRFRCKRIPSQPMFEIEALIWVSFWRALKFQLKRARSNPRRQSKNIEMKYKARIKLVDEFNGTCFQYNVRNYESTI
jgi:hypothetical protein